MRKPGKVKQALQTEELVLLMHASLPVRSAEMAFRRWEERLAKASADRKDVGKE